MQWIRSDEYYEHLKRLQDSNAGFYDVEEGLIQATEAQTEQGLVTPSDEPGLIKNRVSSVKFVDGQPVSSNDYIDVETSPQDLGRGYNINYSDSFNSQT